MREKYLSKNEFYENMMALNESGTKKIKKLQSQIDGIFREMEGIKTEINSINSPGGAKLESKEIENKLWIPKIVQTYYHPSFGSYHNDELVLRDFDCECHIRNFAAFRYENMVTELKERKEIKWLNIEKGWLEL